MIGRLRSGLNLSGLAVVLALVGVWQILIQAGILDLDYLPAPVEIARRASELIADGTLPADAAHTLRTTLIATLLGTVVGGVAGLATGLLPWFRDYTWSSVDLLRTIPVTALVPAALLIWGPSDTAEIAVATYAATWPILINTAGGVRAIPQRLHDVARVMRLSRSERIRKVVVPACTQSILVGVRLGAVTALVLAIVAEMLINPLGLGWGLISAQNALAPAQLWAYTIAVGVLAYVLNLLLVQAVRYALPGSELTQGRAS